MTVGGEHEDEHPGESEMPPAASDQLEAAVRELTMTWVEDAIGTEAYAPTSTLTIHTASDRVWRYFAGPRLP
jgi:hypothetical protein